MPLLKKYSAKAPPHPVYKIKPRPPDQDFLGHSLSSNSSPTPGMSLVPDDMQPWSFMDWFSSLSSCPHGSSNHPPRWISLKKPTMIPLRYPMKPLNGQITHCRTIVCFIAFYSASGGQMPVSSSDNPVPSTTLAHLEINWINEVPQQKYYLSPVHPSPCWAQKAVYK